MWIYFYISANEFNVHGHHTCTIQKLHACKSYDANGCQYVCILVAGIVLIPETNMKNSMYVLNHKPNLQWNWIFFSAVQLSVDQLCSYRLLSFFYFWKCINDKARLLNYCLWHQLLKHSCVALFSSQINSTWREKVFTLFLFQTLQTSCRKWLDIHS